MKFGENHIYYLDEINYDLFEENQQRGSSFTLPAQPIPGLFPENLDIYCPNCIDYMSPHNANNFNPYNAPALPKYFLGTPFFNPVTSQFYNYGSPNHNLMNSSFNSGLHPFKNRPQAFANVLFTTPVIARNSSDLFL